MQVLAKEGFLEKTNFAVTSAIRDSSCSRGWLRLLMQIIFGVITVASFIMIMVMALQRNPQSDSSQSVARRCLATPCRVVCSNAPFYGEFINDLIFVMQEIRSQCPSGIMVKLNNPVFTNETIPPHWLFEVNSNVTELIIVGGNLRYIDSNSFMSSFTKNIRTLVLEDITLVNFGADSLVGLSHLIELDIKDCKIINIHRNALRAVDESLQSLYIRNSGYWSPRNLTGSSDFQKLTKVDFSSNLFGSIIDRESFRQLEICEELRLSSSRISSIEMGAFDFMVNIKRLYLNNNNLLTLPNGIFDRITALANNVKPAIDLQDNLWQCDCYIEHLRRLQIDGYLMIDPTCNTPNHLNGRSFSDFETLCCKGEINDIDDQKNVSNNNNINAVDKSTITRPTSLYIDGSCYSRKFGLLNKYQCVTNRARYLAQDILLNMTNNAKSKSSHIVPTFSVKSSADSLVEIQTDLSKGYDLIWYQSTCLTEVYCVSSMPKFLRIYNVDRNSTYTFCVIEEATGALWANNCISYIPYLSPSNTTIRAIYFQILTYFITVMMSVVIGATCLYTVIRRNPTLLRGSKRILLVKHKAVDALVLPPKVTTRNEYYSEAIPKKEIIPIYTRRNSIKSITPSYISALQPTEAQLAEWRLKYHFNNGDNINNDLNITPKLPIRTENTLVSYIYDVDSLYYSVDTIDNKKRKDEYLKP